MFKDTLKTIIISLIMLFVVGVAYAWTEPSSNPPTGNTSGPVTVNSPTIPENQIKYGGLGVSSLDVTGSGYFAGSLGVSGNLGIGTENPTKKIEVAETTGGDIYEKSGTTCNAGDTLIEYKADVKTCDGKSSFLCTGGTSCTTTGYDWQATYDSSKATCAYKQEPPPLVFTCTLTNTTCSSSTVKCQRSLTTAPKFTVDNSGNTYMAGKVGIGTINPGAKLEVNGDIKITGGNPGEGKVLTSDANGLASWQPSGGGMVFLDAPQYVIASGNGAINWTKFNAAPYVSASAIAVILDGGGYAKGAATIKIKKTSTSTVEYALITLFDSYIEAHTGFLLDGRENQGIFPLAADKSFYYRTGAFVWGSRWARLIGYVE